MFSLFRRPKLNPFATVQGVLDELERQATERRDMTTVGRLQAARNIITREALRGAR